MGHPTPASYVLRAALPACIACQAAAPAPWARTYAPAALKADLARLWTALKAGHGGLDRYASLPELEAQVAALEHELQAPITATDFYVKLSRLLARLRDGHTSLSLSEALDSELDAQPIMFPFGLRFVQGRSYLFWNLSSTASVADGSELLAINGIPMAGILDRLLPMMMSDAGILTRKLRQLEDPGQFSSRLALCLRLPDTYRIRYLPPGASVPRETTVPGIPYTSIAPLLKGRYPRASRATSHELTFRDEIAILRIGSFMDGKGGPPFPAFLRASFQALADRTCRGLVIDLRGNRGGTDEYGRLLFAHAVDRPFRYYQALETRSDRFAPSSGLDLSPEAAQELAGRTRPNARGWFDYLNHPNLGMLPAAEPHFGGPIAILVNGLSLSTTGECTSLFHHHRRATFFGEECGSGYYGNVSGMMASVTLPNTGIVVEIPLVRYTMAVSGHPLDQGIRPDVPVEASLADLMAGRDPVLEKALDWLKKPGGPARRDSGRP